MDIQAISEALQVVVVGMALVFLALTVLYFVILGLERAFRERDEPAVEEPPAALVATAAPSHAPDQVHLAAAIAVSLAMAQEAGSHTGAGGRRHARRGPGQSGMLSGPRASVWADMGRRQQMNRASIPSRRTGLLRRWHSPRRVAFGDMRRRSTLRGSPRPNHKVVPNCW